MTILNGQQIVDTDFVSTSAGAGDSGKVPKLNASGKLSGTFYFDIDLGGGEDGNVTISAPTTLTRDMYYNNLTVNNVLTTDGYRIFVLGTLSGTGTIKHNGNNGAVGVDGVSGVSYGTGGSGGLTSGGGVFKTGAGGAGGDGNTPNGNAGGVTTDGNYKPFSLLGGAGGTGSSSSGNGGAGGTAGTTVIVPYSTEKTYYWGFGLDSTLLVKSIKKWGGTGGGGGGRNTGFGNERSGGGGGGGASGGVVWIACTTFAGTFTIQATGGNGGNGGGNGGSGGGGGGGGAGGNGGLSVVIYKAKTWSGSYTLTGGTGGTASTRGVNGATGTTGLSYELQLV